VLHKINVERVENKSHVVISPKPSNISPAFNI